MLLLVLLSTPRLLLLHGIIYMYYIFYIVYMGFEKRDAATKTRPGQPSPGDYTTAGRSGPTIHAIAAECYW